MKSTPTSKTTNTAAEALRDVKNVFRAITNAPIQQTIHVKRALRELYAMQLS
jgi:hypothetical protein